MEKGTVGIALAGIALLGLQAGCAVLIGGPRAALTSDRPIVIDPTNHKNGDDDPALSMAATRLGLPIPTPLDNPTFEQTQCFARDLSPRRVVVKVQSKIRAVPINACTKSRTSFARATTSHHYAGGAGGGGLGGLEDLFDLLPRLETECVSSETEGYVGYSGWDLSVTTGGRCDHVPQIKGSWRTDLFASRAEAEADAEAHLRADLGDALVRELAGAGQVLVVDGDTAQVTTVVGAEPGDLLFVGPTPALDEKRGTPAVLRDEHTIVRASPTSDRLTVDETVVPATSNYRLDIFPEGAFFAHGAHGTAGMRADLYRRAQGPLFGGSVGLGAIEDVLIAPAELHAGYSFEPLPSTLGLYALAGGGMLVARGAGALGSLSVGAKISIPYVLFDLSGGYALTYARDVRGVDIDLGGPFARLGAALLLQ